MKFLTAYEESQDIGNDYWHVKETARISDLFSKHTNNCKYLDPKKFKKFTIENGNLVWGKNWDLIFPIELLYAGKVV